MQRKCTVITALLMALVYPLAAQALEQDFPTGDPGYAVSFVSPDTPGSISGCVAAISRGLPKMAFALNFFGRNAVTLTVSYTFHIPDLPPGTGATMRVNGHFLLGTIFDEINMPDQACNYSPPPATHQAGRIIGCPAKAARSA